jgi:hypothetical protein
MADVPEWERRFVERYIVEDAREEYLRFLKGRKRRKKILDRLNESLDYDASLARDLDPALRDPPALVAHLKSLYVRPTCHLMADGCEEDGEEVRLEHGVAALLGNHWGGVLICPPDPIAVYKGEGTGAFILLAPRSA